VNRQFWHPKSDRRRKLFKTAQHRGIAFGTIREVPAQETPVLYSVDLCDCAMLASLQIEQIVAAFARALERAGATVVGSLSHGFPGTGLTCVLILAESHAVIHTWPETGTVNVDIFSCSTRLRSLEAIGELRAFFGASQASVQEIARADGHERSLPVGRV
jgi:S-adenosylmethionine decarboxylase proenzyme